MHEAVMMRIFFLLNTFLLCSGLFAESAWEVRERQIEILLDGYLDEWVDVPSIALVPGGAGLQEAGEFGDDDLALRVMALWDKKYLYLALDWRDDIWDIEKVPRREAVWIDPKGTRRDRMHFYDNFKFHIRKSDYDYTMWISPRAGDEGPHYWCRLLEGYGGMERATGAPMITGREQEGRVTLEVLLLWKQLKLKPKKNQRFPLALVVADADLPGKLLDSKVEQALQDICFTHTRCLCSVPRSRRMFNAPRAP